MQHQPTILITGATGLIGGTWTPILALRARVFALVRGTKREVPDASVTLNSDLAEFG